MKCLELVTEQVVRIEERVGQVEKVVVRNSKDLEKIQRVVDQNTTALEDEILDRREQELEAP